jgi:hypothetical protein
LKVRHRPDESVGAALADERSRLDQGLDALFEEERVAFRPFDQESLEQIELVVVAEQRVQELGGGGGQERVDPELALVALARPRVLVLRSVVDEQEDAGRRQALHQGVEKGLGLAVDPVEVLEHQHERRRRWTKKVLRSQYRAWRPKRPWRVREPLLAPCLKYRVPARNAVFVFFLPSDITTSPCSSVALWGRLAATRGRARAAAAGEASR